MKHPTRAVLGALLLSASATLAQGATSVTAPAATSAYKTMAPIAQYRIASRDEEITIARSAAPASISSHAEILVLGKGSYETAVKGTNGFVCMVERSWAQSFDHPEFWNPKIRGPECLNPAAARSVLPAYLQLTCWVLAGDSIAEMRLLTEKAWAAGTKSMPEPGALAYMMSPRGYLSDASHGPWFPHVMFYMPRKTQDVDWGANLHGTFVQADATSHDAMTYFFVIVPKWSDGSPWQRAGAGGRT